MNREEGKDHFDVIFLKKGEGETPTWRCYGQPPRRSNSDHHLFLLLRSAFKGKRRELLSL